MKNKKVTWLVAAEICLLALLAAVIVLLALKPEILRKPEATEPTVITTAAPTTEATTQPATEVTTQATTEPVTEPATEPSTEPVPQSYYLTFAGDCTLGTMYQLYGIPSCFPGVVGENYEYPFAAVQQWFAADDFTMVNLEGPLTRDGTPADKTYCFRGDPELANILPAGSVECVSLANNHSEDFGPVGYENTRKALDGVGVAYAGNGETILVETERGLKIGILAIAFYIDHEEMAEKIVSLRDQGAQVVVVSFHWGNEGYYSHTYDQQWYAYAAIDAGASIVYGHHPHVLQPIEEYNGGIIYYSLGNFAFGGNDCPKDFDTAFISQEVIVDVDGTVRLGTCTPVPCCISPFENTNKYQPTPAEEGSARYERVMDKLSGNYFGPNIAPTDPTEEDTTGETTDSTGETPTDMTQAPEEETEAASTEEAESSADETTAPAEENE